MFLFFTETTLRLNWASSHPAHTFVFLLFISTVYEDRMSLEDAPVGLLWFDSSCGMYTVWSPDKQDVTEFVFERVS